MMYRWQSAFISTLQASIMIPTAKVMENARCILTSLIYQDLPPEFYRGLSHWYMIYIFL